jgi:serine/threonine protein kinase
MHSKGVCHRDLKPHNVMVTNSGTTIKITDFNVSKSLKVNKEKEKGELSLDELLLGGNSDVIRMQTKTGTLAFSAPEMINSFSYK